MVVKPVTIPPPGLHGGDGPRVAEALGIAIENILDLSQSLNPVAPDPQPIVQSHLHALERYPDATVAQHTFASLIGVDPDRLLLTNGGAEAIALVTALIGGSVNEPEFSLHPRGKGPRWRSNPHSPSGLLAAKEDAVAVWDEAFYPLATGSWTRGDANTIVVGSLTKVLACPGLRIGYVIADPSFVLQCRSLQPTWSVNGLVASALPDLLAQLDLEKSVVEIRRLRQQLRALLEHHGMISAPSDANWLLVRAPGLRDTLAYQGIVVRDCSSFGLVDVVRIAVPNEEGLERLDHALTTSNYSVDLSSDLQRYSTNENEGMSE
jgi:histidinol-phosphate/aromatic aminotransferase/cobyric acid decarboxylase-like protein